MAPQSRCKGCKRAVRRCREGPRPLLHSHRGLEGEGPRAVVDPRRAHRPARRARRAPVQVDVRDRPGRGRASADPARALDVALRERVRPRDRPAPDRLLPHGAHAAGRRWRAVLLERLAAWRTTEHAALLSRVLLVTRTPSGEAPARGLLRRRRRLPRRSRGRAELEPAAPEAPGDGGRPRRLLRPAGFALRSAAGPGLPARRRARRRAARRAMGSLPRSRASCCSSSTTTTCASTSCRSSRRRTSVPLAESEFVVAVVRRDDRSIVFSSDPARPGTWAPPSRVTCSAPCPAAAERAPTARDGLRPTRRGPWAALRRATRRRRPAPPAKGNGQPRRRAPG